MKFRHCPSSLTGNLIENIFFFLYSESFVVKSYDARSGFEESRSLHLGSADVLWEEVQNVRHR